MAAVRASRFRDGTISFRAASTLRRSACHSRGTPPRSSSLSRKCVNAVGCWRTGGSHRRRTANRDLAAGAHNGRRVLYGHKAPIVALAVRRRRRCRRLVGHTIRCVRRRRRARVLECHHQGGTASSSRARAALVSAGCATVRFGISMMDRAHPHAANTLERRASRRMRIAAAGADGKVYIPLASCEVRGEAN